MLFPDILRIVNKFFIRTCKISHKPEIKDKKDWAVRLLSCSDANQQHTSYIGGSYCNCGSYPVWCLVMLCVKVQMLGIVLHNSFNTGSKQLIQHLYTSQLELRSWRTNIMNPWKLRTGLFLPHPSSFQPFCTEQSCSAMDVSIQLFPWQQPRMCQI